MPRGASGRLDAFVGITTTPDWIDAVAEEQASSSSTSSMAWTPTAKSSVRGTALKPLAQLPRFGRWHLCGGLDLLEAPLDDDEGRSVRAIDGLALLGELLLELAEYGLG